MKRRFDASDKNAKELRANLANNREKVAAHAVSIKHLELRMVQLYTNVNPRQPGTLLRNTIQNPSNDGHCMAITIR